MALDSDKDNKYRETDSQRDKETQRERETKRQRVQMGKVKIMA